MPQDQRPTPKQLKALRDAAAGSWINTADAEECVDRGWLEAQPGGGYALTESGRRELRRADAP